MDTSQAGANPPAGAEPVQNSSSESKDSAGKAQPGKAEAAAAEAKRKFRVKIDEQEQEIDEDELVRGYQLRKASEQRFRKASELEKTARQKHAEVEAFTKDPFAALKKAGVPKDQMLAVAEQLLLEHIEYEQLSPEAKRAIQAERERDQLKSDLEKRTEKERAQDHEKAQAKALREIDEEVHAAIKATGKKPTPLMIARISETLIAHYEAQVRKLEAEYGKEIPDDAFEKLGKVDVSNVVARVRKGLDSESRDYIRQMTVAELREALSSEQQDGLREDEVRKVLAQDPVGSRKEPKREVEQVSRQKPKRMSSDEFFKQLEKKLG